jgi:hypothetical protein
VNAVAQLVVILAGCYLVGLALVAWFAPETAKRFLTAFAATASAHYLEMSTRLLVGGAFVLRSPFMPFADAFRLFGWALVVTTVCLLVLPWAWHQRFAQRVVPPALDRMGWLAVPSFALGCFVLAGAAIGSGAHG